MNSQKAEDIGNSIRNNVAWQQLPQHLKQLLHNDQHFYEKYVFNYSLKNQLRFRCSLLERVFRREQRYYELMVQKSIESLCIFPYHLSDIITKGLRVTPFNYYLDVLGTLLRNDKSYDTLPNFTAADCLRILGIGRNEYLSLISNMKTHPSRSLIFRTKPNPMEFLPRFPVRIHIEPWWLIQLGNVLEEDIYFVTSIERGLIDDLIDFGPQMAGKCDLNVVQSVYRKGLIYLDVPISGDDRICIPPLRNFVMNRVSGDYFENLLYKVFVSADEHMTIAELAQMLQVALDTIKQAVSLLCRLGFAQLKVNASGCGNANANANPNTDLHNDLHKSWMHYKRPEGSLKAQITPLNYNAFIMAEANNTISMPIPMSMPMAMDSTATTAIATNDERDNSIGYLSSDGNSDFSFANVLPLSTLAAANDGGHSDEPESSSSPEDLSESVAKLMGGNSGGGGGGGGGTTTTSLAIEKSGQRVGFLFDSTLTAFLMMGNLSPGLKNHAVTMFEVGKLCEESLDTFLAELEKVSLLDADSEGDVSRYFTHAVILRSTICSLRPLLPGGLDLLRLECLESLDHETRDRLLAKKYKFIISATPLIAHLTQRIRVPFFGQFSRSCDSAHMWTKLFYNHISGYGPPSLLLCRGTSLRSLPRIFLGYGKLLVNILHSDSYIISSENFLNLREQLKNGCILVQGYGIRTPAEVRIEAFPFDLSDDRQRQWGAHKAVQRLRQHLDLERTCGFITFIQTGVLDIGCDSYDPDVRLRRPKIKTKTTATTTSNGNNKNVSSLTVVTNSEGDGDGGGGAAAMDMVSPTDCSELTSFTLLPHSLEAAAAAAAHTTRSDVAATTRYTLKSPVENYFAVSPQNSSPSNVYTSEDCNELLASELAKCCSASFVDVALAPVRTTPPNVATPTETTDHTEEWTLLDVNFGVPLFDVDCNTRICQQIVKRLHNDEHLQQLPAINAAMDERFMSFVRQCLHFDDEKTPPEWPTIERCLPHPRINLAFENGRVTYWNGR